MEILHETNQFISFLENNERWLIRRLLYYAGNSGYTTDQILTSEHNKSLIKGVIDSVIETAIRYGITFTNLHPDNPIRLFGKKKAFTCANMGISFSTCLHYFYMARQSFQDLIDEMSPPDTHHHRFHNFIALCFHDFEESVIGEWKSFPHEEAIQPEQSSQQTSGGKLYQSVFESLIDPILVYDSYDQAFYWNPAGMKLTGSAQDLNNDYRIIEFPDELLFLKEKIIVFSNSERKEELFEREFNTLEGPRYFKIILKKTLDIGNRFKGVIVVFQDLTDQKSTQNNLEEAKRKAEEADRLKTSFLANMSHEIRTPMNAIIGFTELLLNERHTMADRSEYLKLIRRSSNDLLNIIEDIIDIAKLESKQLKIKYKACKINTICEDLRILYTETLRRYGNQEEVKLILSVYNNNKDLEILTDGERLKQVLSNLLNNSVKFTNRGYIEFGYKKIDTSSILFFVRDSGTGIPETMKERIFDRFFQLEKHASLNLGGAGLGLAICKNIISLLGGEIWVESIEDKGTEFYFRIPLKEAPKHPTIDTAGRSGLLKDNQPDLSGRNILIAEDDDINYMFLKEILLRTGAEIMRARNGLDAINMAESTEKLDIILMDIKMPHVDGIEATKYITSVRPDIPIIAQTAFALEGDKKRCLDAGCCAYITKPVDKHKLFVLLERYLLSNTKMNKEVIKT